jgi:hypothetical protein
MKDINYPVRIKDIPKVEQQNTFNINVFALKDQTDKHSLYPIHISNSSKSQYIVTGSLEQYSYFVNLSSLLFFLGKIRLQCFWL